MIGGPWRGITVNGGSLLQPSEDIIGRRGRSTGHSTCALGLRCRQRVKGACRIILISYDAVLRCHYSSHHNGTVDLFWTSPGRLTDVFISRPIYPSVSYRLNTRNIGMSLLEVHKLIRVFSFVLQLELSWNPLC